MSQTRVMRVSHLLILTTTTQVRYCYFDFMLRKPKLGTVRSLVEASHIRKSQRRNSHMGLSPKLKPLSTCTRKLYPNSDIGQLSVCLS